MYRTNHIAGRPAFLQQSTTGIVDALYGVWCKASNGFHHLLGHSASLSGGTIDTTDAPTNSRSALLPSYILLADEDIVCVEIDQKTHLIDPFCAHNGISKADLYIPYVRDGYVVIQRDDLIALLEKAENILESYQGSADKYVRTAYADEFIDKFNFVKSWAPTLAPPAPYKVAAPWEAHCQ